MEIGTMVLTTEGIAVEGEMLDRMQEALDSGPTATLMSVGNVLDPALESSASQYVQGKIGPRATALITGPQAASPILGIETPADFLAYQGQVRGYPVKPIFVDFSPERLENGYPFHQVGSALKGRAIRPYIVTQGLIEAAESVGASVRDWNRENIGLLRMMNNKLELHRFLRSARVIEAMRRYGLVQEGLHLCAKPHRVQKADIPRFSVEKLSEYIALYKDIEDQVRTLYERAGVSYIRQSAGIVIRPAWGGGFYESVFLQDLGDDMVHIMTESEEFNVHISEVESVIGRILSDWGAEEYILTRKLQVCMSPGYNFALGRDWAYVANPNGQIMKGIMCVGTCSEFKIDVAQVIGGMVLFDGTFTMDPENIERLNAEGKRLVYYLANVMTLNGGKGFCGADLMYTGFFENAFAQIVAGTEYAEEAVGPIAVAEINVRPTQRTMHLLTQIAIMKAAEGRQDKPVSYGDVLQAYQETGISIHYTSHDYWPIGNGWETLLARSDLLAGINGTANGVYIIMPPGGKGGKIGIGIMGCGSDGQAMIEHYKEELMAISP